MNDGNLEDVRDFLPERFLEDIKPLCLSIVQIGSTISGTATLDSDIDLILLVQDDKTAKKVQKVISEQTHSRDELPLDCKVYTEENFNKARNGRDSFFLWCATRDAKVLYGNDSWFRVKLVSSKISSRLWDCISNIESAMDKLESHIEFTGCCYQIYSSLKTVYFADLHILGKTKKSKESYLRSILGDGYGIARERYKWVFQQVKDDYYAEKMRASSSIDKKFGEADYEMMLAVSTRALNFMKPKIPELLEYIG